MKDGKLCADAVEAVLTCAGQPLRGKALERPVGLTPREHEVLSLIAAGNTAKDVARQLDISPKTAPVRSLKLGCDPGQRGPRGHHEYPTLSVGMRYVSNTLCRSLS